MKVIYIYDNNLNCIFKPYVTTLKEFEDNKTRFYREWNDTMYYSEEFIQHPIIDNGIIRNKTEIELIKDGINKLPDGQYLSGDIIIVSEIPEGMVLPYWDSMDNIWIEKASDNEILEKEFKDKQKKYVKERELVALYTTEYLAGIRGNKTEFAQVKEYLKSIYPTRVSNIRNRTMLISINEINRPAVLADIEKEVKNV